MFNGITIQGVSIKGIFMNIHCLKSQFTVGLRTRFYLDNCADRIRLQVFSNLYSVRIQQNERSQD